LPYGSRIGRDTKLKNLSRLTEEVIGNENLISIEETVPVCLQLCILRNIFGGSGLSISKIRVDDKEKKSE
jgi:hypothetical protein